MSDPVYTLTIVRQIPNPDYEPDQNKRTVANQSVFPMLDIREVSAVITEAELITIKQALLKVWA